MSVDLPTRCRVAADFVEDWAGKLGVDRDETGVVELLRESADEIERLRALYDELLYAVSSKFPDESRHATALRYIRQAEAMAIAGEDKAAETDYSEDIYLEVGRHSKHNRVAEAAGDE